MYSYEERLKAVKLYIQYDRSYASVFRKLGYPPSSHSIKLWVKEYEQNGDLHKTYNKANKYSDEQRQAAIRYYVEHGRSKSRTVKALGYPTRQQLTEWIKQDLPDEVRPCTSSQSLVHLSKEQKEQVAIELCTRDGSAQEIADKYNVSRYSIYNWAWDLLGKGNVSPMPKKKRDTRPVTSEEIESLKKEIEQLHGEAEELQRHHRQPGKGQGEMAPLRRDDSEEGAEDHEGETAHGPGQAEIQRRLRPLQPDAQVQVDGVDRHHGGHIEYIADRVEQIVGGMQPQQHEQHDLNRQKDVDYGSVAQVPVPVNHGAEHRAEQRAPYIAQGEDQTELGIGAAHALQVDCGIGGDHAEGHPEPAGDDHIVERDGRDLFIHRTSKAERLFSITGRS